MKKYILYSLIFAFIFFGISILTAMMIGKDNIKDFIEEIAGSNGQYTDITADIADLNGKNIALFNELEIKGGFSKIRIIESPDDFLHVEYPGNKSKALMATSQGETVQYDLKEYYGRLDGQFVLRIFNHENILNISRLDIYQTTFSVPKSIRIISIKSESGDINFESISGDLVKIRSVSSHVELQNITLNKLNLNLISGDLKAKGLVNSGEIETVSGSIKIKNENSHPNLKIASISGAIKLIFLTEPNVKIEFQSVSGLLRLDSETKDFNGKKVITLGQGHGSLNLSTISGAVQVHQIKPSEEE